MRVYIVEYQLYFTKGQSFEQISSHISQEGYSTLEEAQAYIESRPGTPAAISPMSYRTADGREHYIIHDIQIRKEKSA